MFSNATLKWARAPGTTTGIDIDIVLQVHKACFQSHLTAAPGVDSESVQATCRQELPPTARIGEPRWNWGWPVLGWSGQALGRGDVQAEDGEVTRCRSGRGKGGARQGDYKGPEVG